MRAVVAFLLFALIHEAPVQSVPAASVQLGPAPQLPAGEPAQALALPVPQAASIVAVDPASRYQVSLLYRNFYAVEDLATNGWSGSVVPCNAGVTAAAYQDATLERINVFRALAGLPGNISAFATQTNQSDDQAAALMMVANKTLNHDPPGTLICFTQAGHDGASHSNLTLGGGFNYNGPTAIEGYMDDSGGGNEIVGHRRWLLYPPQAHMASGDVDAVTATQGYSANALWVLGPFGSRAATPNGTAWPPRGYMPWQLLPSSSQRWSFSFPGANFCNATLTMTRNGTALGVTYVDKGALEMQCPPNPNIGTYGDPTLVWVPTGATYTQPGQDVVYHVAVSGTTGTGVPANFNYTVTVINPYDAIFADGLGN